jgi:acetyl coenzyme A synthetase (ADP forming)-like protein
MLDAFFNPRSVAVLGASRNETKLGFAILRNVVESGYQGTVYPINPKADEILSLKCYPSVLAVPEPIDLVVIVIPDRLVIPALEDCGKKGVPGVVIISAGFREAGLEGVRRERQVTELAKQFGMRVVGPNCLGIIDTVIPLNASFAAGMPEKGDIGFMSQSGALCTAILDWSLAEGIGFSRFVSLGNKADVEETDLLKAWSEDDATQVIIAYIEGINDGQEFVETARQVTRQKPVIAIKSGTTQAGAKAVSSHTGSLAGSERAYDAAFRQSGILRAPSLIDLFDWATAFAWQPLPQGNRLAIVTNAGGPGILASDQIERLGLQLASLRSETVEKLRGRLPAAANVLNPIDVLGDAGKEVYAFALETALQDSNVDGVVTILAPQVYTPIEETGQAVGEVAARYDKPVVGCFMGEAKMRAGMEVLKAHRVPNYAFPERAVAALRAMANYRDWLARPRLKVEHFDADQARVAQLFQKVRSERRVTLGESEARQVIDAYGFRLPRSELAHTADDAVALAESIGYPVALKLASPDILHKSDIGGVKLRLTDTTAVRDAFDLIIFRATRFMPEAEIWGCLVQEMVTPGREMIVGMSRDPQFGPLVACGMGGIYVEVLKDVAFRLAPLSRQDAREMLTELQSYQLLRGVRGERPADLEAVADAVLRVAQLVTDFPEVVELDINPLVVHEKGAVAIDVRLALK